MRFFEPPPHKDQPDEPTLPPWFSPPPDELGQVVPLRAVVARSERCAIGIGGLVAYSNGFEIALRMRLRDVDDWIDPLGHRQGPPWSRRDLNNLPDDLLRMGIDFAGGIRATSVEGFSLPTDATPAAYLQVSGGGGGRRWDFTCWVWPLPSKPPTSLVVEWPSLGIQLTRYELPTGQIVEAGRQSGSIWS